MADIDNVQIQVVPSSPGPRAMRTQTDAIPEPNNKKMEEEPRPQELYAGLNLSDGLKDTIQRPRTSVSLDQPSSVTNLRRPSIIEMLSNGGLVINQRGSCEINLDNLPAQDVEMMYHFHGHGHMHRRGSYQPSETNQSLDTKDSSIGDQEELQDVNKYSWWSFYRWSGKFNSPILETHLGKTVIEFLRRRFRLALLFIGLFSLIWLVFFATSIPFAPPHPSKQRPVVSADLAIYSVSYDVSYVVGAAVLFVCTIALLVVTYSQYYKNAARILSLSFIILLMCCSWALALGLHFNSEVEGSLTMAYVAQFTLTAIVILMVFTLSRLPIWGSLILCIPYLIILEILLAIFTYIPQDESVSESLDPYPLPIYINLMVARVMFYLGFILVGVSTSYLSQLRQKVTFWKIAQCVLSQKALELERELEEKTILSMMPKPFADDLMNVQVQMAFMLKTKMDVEIDESLEPQFQSISTPFNICSMNNVSILFADIVGFTKFSSTLSASELVGILNTVFSKFDELATQNNCEKISTQGDCYFCVSGCPEPATNHADNCVTMGLSIVKALEELGYGIQMRIGIHTGSVFCGVMGTKRFKFDVWSKDVRIAKEIESTSSPGRVLISSATKSFLSDDFIYQRISTPKGVTDLSGLKLYFVDQIPPATDTSDAELSLLKEDTTLEPYRSVPTRPSLSTCESPIRPVHQESSLLCPCWRTKHIAPRVGRPLHESQTATSIVDIFSRQKQLQKCTSYAELPVPKSGNENNDKIVELMEEQNVNFETYFDPQLKGISLHYHNPDLETSYRNHGQHLDDGSNACMAEMNLGFRITKLSYMIDTAVLFLNFVLITIGAAVCLSSEDTLQQIWPSLLAVVAIGLVIESAIMVFVTAVFAPKLFPQKFAKFSLFIVNWYARAVVALFMIYYPMAVVCVSIAQCKTGLGSVAGLAHVQMAFFITVLVLISSISFMDVSYLVKCIGGFLSAALAVGMIVGVHMTLCIESIPTNYTLPTDTLPTEEPVTTTILPVDHNTSPSPPPINRVVPTESPATYIMTYFTRHVAPETMVLLLLVLILLMVVNRMSEVSVRLSFIARIEAAARRRLARLRKAQADWLLYNIIPDDVAKELRKSGSYSKNHDCVGVIFASIVNFRDFQMKTPNSDEQSLRVLNLIVSEFDALLDREQFSSIEKIKTIGSTYMAASGLSLDPKNRGIEHLLDLINFSEKLIEVLENINAQMPGFVFRMRIGFNFGPLTAGVVGCRKMLFDIWGDTVNVASRMDSTGLVSKIHMPEICLNRLSPFVNYEGYKVINVKGKGEMRTVFVKQGSRNRNVPVHRATNELH